MRTQINNIAVILTGIMTMALYGGRANADVTPAPANLVATAQSANNASAVGLTWTGVAGASYYAVIRNGTYLTSANFPAFTDAKVTGGVTYTYTVAGVNKSGTGPASNVVTFTAPAPPVPLVPLAPGGLTASAEWVTYCPICGGSMGHINLSWISAPGAVTYNLYRNGALYQPNLATTIYTDMTVANGQTYTYTVAAVNAGGVSPVGAPATAVAPLPPSSPPTVAPTNLVVQGIWTGSAPTDNIAWSPVPGAVSYNVYSYGTLVTKSVTATSYTIPTAVYWPLLTYTVTAVTSAGAESIPSNIVMAQGSFNPNNLPNWSPGPVVIPALVIAAPEWNAGSPRIRLAWHGSGNDYTYNVYRDGQPVAVGLWGLAYFDNNVQPGETHSYTVTGVNVPLLTPVESPPSTAVTATALLAAPAPVSQKILISKVIANDDSVYVSFAAIPGAVDYRISNLANPGVVKYSAGGLNVELNGLDAVNGADLVVEAVDKFGPFQSMDGMAGPGMLMTGTTTQAINGIGDPSDQPNVLAASDAFHVTPQPRALTGSQVFFDNFRNDGPLVQMTSLDPVIVANNGADPNDVTNRYVREYQNNNWMVRDYWGDMDNTSFFFMGNHFMDTLYDGGSPRSNILPHNNNATLVFSPKATGDISGGKVLHVTFEVDAHVNGRRWVDVFVAAAGDPLIHPGKFSEAGQNPTVSGNLFRWEIKGGSHSAQMFLGGVGTDVMTPTGWPDQQSYARTPANGTLGSNGGLTNLDKRHHFDLYLSQTHFKIVETAPDGIGNMVHERDFPAGVSLPFTNAQVYFVHQLYHTYNDRPENVNYGTADTYWINYRPWADERHWDNMGFEVLPSF